MTRPFQTFTTDVGYTFTVRVVPTGERYGNGDSFTADAPLIEFYDTQFADGTADDPGRFGPLGQFVTRYRHAQLITDRVGDRVTGLNLDGGIPAWSVDAATMRKIMEWATGEMVPTA